MHIAGGTASFDGCEFSANSAGEHGGGLHSSGGTIKLGQQTLITGNTATSGKSIHVIGSAIVTYTLPAPLGRWIFSSASAYQTITGSVESDYPFHVRSSTCRNERCTHLHARLACCMARNILTRMLALPPRSDEKHPPDSICVCLPCGSHSSTRPGSAGLYGNGTGASHQSGPQCTGLCPPGSFCSGATSVPKLCPLGSFCPAGTTVPQPCPGGTWLGTMGAASASSCTPVQAGYWAPLAAPLHSAAPHLAFAALVPRRIRSTRPVARCPSNWRAAARRHSPRLRWYSSR